MNARQLKTILETIDDDTEIFVVDDKTIYLAQINILPHKGKTRLLFVRASSSRRNTPAASTGEAEKTEQ